MSIYLGKMCVHFFATAPLKGTVMQIEKDLIKNCLLISKVSWKFHTSTIYNLTVIYQWYLLFP